jgi:hypothetical protein
VRVNIRILSAPGFAYAWEFSSARVALLQRQLHDGIQITAELVRSRAARSRAAFRRDAQGCMPPARIASISFASGRAQDRRAESGADSFRFRAVQTSRRRSSCHQVCHVLKEDDVQRRRNGGRRQRAVTACEVQPRICFSPARGSTGAILP